MNVDGLVQIIDRLINETLPRIERTMKEYVDNRLSQRMRNQSRIIFFDSYNGSVPSIANPSEIATYQNKSDGSRWWYGGGSWHKQAE